MEKSAMTELESKDCESSDGATIRSRRISKENVQLPAKKAKLGAKRTFPEHERVRKVFVTGYGTCLDPDAAQKAVIKHFSSCGEVLHFIGPDVDESGGLEETCLAFLRGEGVVDKALKLKGACKCDVDGCKIVVDQVMVEDDGSDKLVIGELNLPEWKRAEIRDSMKQAQKHD